MTTLRLVFSPLSLFFSLVCFLQNPGTDRGDGGHRELMNNFSHNSRDLDPTSSADALSSKRDRLAEGWSGQVYPNKTLSETQAGSCTEQLFQLMIEGVSDRAIFVVTPEGQIASWNQGVERLLGYGEDEWVGRSVAMIFTPEDQAAGIPGLELEGARSKRRETQECYHVRKDSSLFWAENFTAVLLDKQGKVQGFTLIIRDCSEQKANESKLEKNRTLLELTQNAAHVASWDWDFSTGQVTWSHNAESIFGTRPPETFVEFEKLVLPEDLGAVAAIAQQAIDENKTYESEFRVRWPSGRISWLMGRGQPLYDQQGKPVRLLGVNLEITERKKLEMERDRFFEMSADPLCIVGSDGYFKRLNPAWRERLGYSEKELLSRPYMEFIHPDDRPETWAIEQEALKSHSTHFTFENRFLHKKGGFRWFLWSARSDTIDGTIYAAARDITDRKQVETHFRRLADSIPQLAWMANSEGWIYWYNQRWYDYTGTNLPEVEGWGWKKVHHPDHLPRVLKSIQHSWDSGEPWEETFPLRSRNGEWRWFLSRAVPIKDEADQLILWFGTNTDITKEKELSEELRLAKNAAEEANRTKSAFLANISHELRTPLGAILGFAELLKDCALRKEERDLFIETIIRNGKQLAELIGDVLDLSKIEAGKVEVERLKLSLPRFLDETMETLAGKAREKGIDLRLDISKEIPETIESDPLRLRQILFNLIGNAIKFTDRGSVTTQVKMLGQPTGERAKIAFVVSDTGRGIPYEAQEVIFQPFHQADNSTTRKYGGTGLGLAISQKLARLLGGDVVLSESEPGQGSSFTLTLDIGIPYPEKVLQTRNRRHPLQENNKGSSRLSGLNVLVAEDSLDNQLLIRKMLQRQGARVDIAGNGREAVQRALTLEYDVVLMDIQMPLMDGYDATRELRSKGYRGPIVALTAHALSDERDKSLRSGCDDHLTKPLSTPRLISTIERFAPKN